MTADTALSIFCPITLSALAGFLGVLGPRKATVPALNCLNPKEKGAYLYFLQFDQPTLATTFLNNVLAYFTLCLDVGILLRSSDLAGGMDTYQQLARVIACYLVLAPDSLGLASAVGELSSGRSRFMGYPGDLVT
jgi:hypothetical protein